MTSPTFSTLKSDDVEKKNVYVYLLVSKYLDCGATELGLGKNGTVNIHAQGCILIVVGAHGRMV